MDVLINGKKHTLGVPIASGGEGDIYSLDLQSLAKIYHKNVISRERRLKVLALCNSYANNVAYLGNDLYAFPIHPAYENQEGPIDLLCGFSMQFFRDCPTLGDIGYDLSSRTFKSAKGVTLDADKAVEFIYNVFDVVDRLHKARIILGDVNPLNILYNRNTNYPIIIDLDAAQVGQFRCLSWSDEYIDPLAQEQGKNMQGGYTYSYETDIFSIACVCFEFFVGINPFFVRTDPPNDVVQNKKSGISLLRYLHSNTNVLNGVRYLSNPVNNNIKGRILFLKTKYPKLYDFFVSIFLDNRRISLLQTLDRSDPRHPAYIFYSQSGFDNILKQIISQRKQLKVAQPLATAPTVVGIFTIPDSGFSKVVPVSNVVQTVPLPTQTTSIKLTDPDQLLKFLKNYSVDTTNLIGGI